MYIFVNRFENMGINSTYENLVYTKITHPSHKYICN